MNTETMSREKLLERIDSLERLNRELLKEKEQEARLEFAWTGNLGHWYWNVKTNEVTFNPLKVLALGYTQEEIPEKVDYQFFTDKLHPEDYQKAMEAMKDHLYGRSEVYEVEYRIQGKNGEYRWYYDRGKITQYEDGKPVFLSGIVFDTTEKNRIQGELEQKNRILQEMSSIDGLTQIYNHKTLVEYLGEKIKERGGGKSPLSIIMLDVDYFKKINDSKGHVFGDEVLVKVAQLIKEAIRESDVVGRYGGEEFMVILPATNGENAARLAERIRQTIENHSIGDGVALTISGGVKEFEGESVAEFIHKADLALYEAKNKGRNQIVRYKNDGKKS